MLDKTKLPKHVALIVDGNRRWAKSHHIPSIEGHRKGAQTCKQIIAHAWSLGIPIVTIWVFSTENWDRSTEEVSCLMSLFEQGVESHLDFAKKHHARIIHLGRKDRVSEKLQKKIIQAEEETIHFSDRFLCIALDYGGADEIVRAISKIQSKHGDCPITPEMISDNLDTSVLPKQSPDLVIRTGGAQRTSGFMLWQIGYSELMFVDKSFPDFTPADFDTCVESYQMRERRFGK